jgi:hypothetical protein
MKRRSLITLAAAVAALAATGGIGDRHDHHRRRVGGAPAEPPGSRLKRRE